MNCSSLGGEHQQRRNWVRHSSTLPPIWKAVCIHSRTCYLTRNLAIGKGSNFEDITLAAGKSSFNSRRRQARKNAASKPEGSPTGEREGRKRREVNTVKRQVSAYATVWLAKKMWSDLRLHHTLLPAQAAAVWSHCVPRPSEKGLALRCLSDNSSVIFTVS